VFNSPGGGVSLGPSPWNFQRISVDGQGTCRRNIGENFNHLIRVHERYRQTTDKQTDRRQTDGRQHIANVNVTFAKNEQNKRTITRRPCCRKEPSRDAKHLYRKLAPNPTQWIERTLKLSANMGKLLVNHFTSVGYISEGLMHVVAWYHWTPGPKFTKFGE